MHDFEVVYRAQRFREGVFGSELRCTAIVELAVVSYTLCQFHKRALRRGGVFRMATEKV